jgi:hypothetical protein
MKTSVKLLALGLFGVIATQAGVVSAATFDATIGGQNYTIVEVDTANTVREAGGGAWSAVGGGAGLWNERTYSPFNTGYLNLVGNPSNPTNRVFEASGDATVPALTTTVSGLSAGQYNVFLLYTYRVSTEYIVGTQAALNGVAASGSFYTNADAIANFTGPDWGTGLAPIGTTPEGVTSFSVGLAAPISVQAGNVERTHALAVAYQPVPEPASGLILLLGAASCVLVARRKR